MPPCGPPKPCPPPPPWPPRAYAGAPPTRSNAAISAVIRTNFLINVPHAYDAPVAKPDAPFGPTVTDFGQPGGVLGVWAFVRALPVNFVRGFAVQRAGELPARGAASCGYFVPPSTSFHEYTATWSDAAWALMGTFTS